MSKEQKCVDPNYDDGNNDDDDDGIDVIDPTDPCDMVFSVLFFLILNIFSDQMWTKRALWNFFNQRTKMRL